MSTLAVNRNNSPVKCCVAPNPGLANTILPGLAFAAAISSLTLFAGKSGRVTMIKPAVAIMEIESNEASVS